MTPGNGANTLAALDARIAELEAAISTLARRIEEQYRARLLALEADVERLSFELAVLQGK